MKIEYEIQELNRRIDETYDEYVKNLTELRNKKNALAQHCNSNFIKLWNGWHACIFVPQISNNKTNFQKQHS